MQYYPDSTTYSLVGAASELLEMPAEDILFEFGRFWVLYTSKEGYGPIMDLFGNDFKSCLQNLNNLHARMGMTLPQLTPPRFTFEELGPETYQLNYYSKREGLSPMVSGLLHGLAEKFGAKISISVASSKEEADLKRSLKIQVVT